MREIQFMVRIALAATWVLAVANLTHAGTITTADGSGADTRVRRSLPATIFGALDSLRIQNKTTIVADARKTYLRFDLTSLGSADFSAAELQLTPTDNYAVGGGVTFDLFGLNDLNLGESWGELAINWSNAPENDTSSNSGVLAGTTSLGSFTFLSDFVAGTPISFASAAIRDFLNADTNNLATFILTKPAASDTNFQFASKENLDELQFPTLNVTPEVSGPTAVPEPSLIAIGAILSCFVGMGYLLRRRARLLEGIT